jgi:hypothetical protein
MLLVQQKPKSLYRTTDETGMLSIHFRRWVERSRAVD